MRRELVLLLWGDLYWSPAFHASYGCFEARYPILVNAPNKNATELIQPASATFRETGNDCSIHDSLSIQVPLKEIVEGLSSVKSDPERGAWRDSSGQIVGLDRSVTEDGPKALLVRRDKFESYLRSSSFAFVWTLLNKKQVVGGWGSGPRTRLVTSGAHRFVEGPDAFSIVGGMTPCLVDW